MRKRIAGDKMREIMNADNYRYNCSIENFIVDEYSICREERQYAVFLYNILRKYKKSQSREKLVGEEKDNILKIFEACGIEADSDIEHVFYEATFMRDFFERERRYYAVKNKDLLSDVLLQQSYEKERETKTDFNRRLIEYALEWEYKDSPEIKSSRNDKKNDEENEAYLQYNLGGNIPKELAGLEIPKEVREKARAMMNSKPDIAVIYKKGSQRYLLFIECKFESSESKYNSLSQSAVQYHIAEFLCRYLNERNGQEYINLSEKMKLGQSRIVKFRRSGSGRQGPYLPEDGNILIKMLVDYNNKIFDNL